jgi:hypothetical protein
VIQHVEPLQDDFRIPASLVPHLPQRLAAVQTFFQRTGGVHAAALFDRRGERSLIREDVGRHNAVDRVIGSRWLAGLTCCESILFVSARASFELIQKAALARIPVFAAVGAPTSLAVDLARELNVRTRRPVHRVCWSAPDSHRRNGMTPNDPSLTPEELTGLRVGPPETVAVGMSAVVSSLAFAWGQAGLARGTRALRVLNQIGGTDCPSCAWPDPDEHRSMAEYM